MRRYLPIAILLTVGVAIAIYFLTARKGSDDSLQLSGNIEAHESLVSFKAVQSRIVELPIEEGQWLEAGATIAQLDDSDYRKQLDMNSAALQVQERQLASALEKVEIARATIANDKADIAQKEVDFSRQQKLFKAAATSAQQRDLAETALKQSQAALARDEAAERGAERDVEVAKANIHNAEQAVDLAKINLGFTVLRAPFSGVVLVRNAELGEVMLPGTPVITLADVDHVWMRGYVSETDLARVHFGQEANVTTDSYPDRKYKGQISFISSQAEFTPKSVETHKERVTLVYRVKIDIQNPQHELKPGMPADAMIDLNGMRIPRQTRQASNGE